MENSMDYLGVPPTGQYYPEGGNYSFKDTDGKSCERYKYFSGKNSDVRGRFIGILMSIPADDQDKYEELS